MTTTQKPTSMPPCHFYLSYSWCKKGSKCRFSHSGEAHPKKSAKPSPLPDRFKRSFSPRQQTPPRRRTPSHQRTPLRRTRLSQERNFSSPLPRRPSSRSRSPALRKRQRTPSRSPRRRSYSRRRSSSRRRSLSRRRSYSRRRSPVNYPSQRTPMRRASPRRSRSPILRSPSPYHRRFSPITSVSREGSSFRAPPRTPEVAPSARSQGYKEAPKGKQVYKRKAERSMSPPRRIEIKRSDTLMAAREWLDKLVPNVHVADTKTSSLLTQSVATATPKAMREATLRAFIIERVPPMFRNAANSANQTLLQELLHFATVPADFSMLKSSLPFWRKYQHAGRPLAGVQIGRIIRSLNDSYVFNDALFNIQ